MVTNDSVCWSMQVLKPVRFLPLSIDTCSDLEAQEVLQDASRKSGFGPGRDNGSLGPLKPQNMSPLTSIIVPEDVHVHVSRIGIDVGTSR